MSKQVNWSKEILEFFIEQALLNPFEEEIMRTRINGVPVKEQASRCMCSISKVEKTIALLKKKYDLLQKQYPDKLPMRRASAKELYMDTH